MIIGDGEKKAIVSLKNVQEELFYWFASKQMKLCHLITSYCEKLCIKIDKAELK